MARTEEVIEHGLERISSARRIELPLRDILRLYSLLGELIAFFHTSRAPDEIQEFLGTRNSGALRALWDAYYGYLRDVWPDDVAIALEDGVFDAGPPGATSSVLGRPVPASSSQEGVHSFSMSDGEVQAWIDGDVHLRALTPEGDPVELSAGEANAIADALRAMAAALV